MFWFDERGNRYPAPEDALKQERILREQEQILREREQLIRRELEERLAKEEQARIQLIVRQLNRKVGSIPARALEQINRLTLEHLEGLGEALLDFDSPEDLTAWLENLD